MPSSAALSRRKGGGGPTSRPIPWAYIGVVLGTIALVFFFLYVQALNNVIHHHASGHPLIKDKSQLRGGGEAHVDKPPAPGETLVLTTKLGALKIQLLKELSSESVDYLTQIVKSGNCPRCQFHRAEDKGILQGTIRNPDIPNQVNKGPCPQDLLNSKWKGNCHGPIMNHGMVGWAAGKTGPDFFIDWYKRPATFWGAQHTVWGHVLLDDDESLKVMDKIWELPVHKKGLTYLDEPLQFTMSLK